MARPILQNVEVTSDGVRRGDVIAVGGIPHRVADVRELQGRCKRLEFEDGNAYVLRPYVTITVARAYAGGGGFVRPR